MQVIVPSRFLLSKGHNQKNDLSGVEEDTFHQDLEDKPEYTLEDGFPQSFCDIVEHIGPSPMVQHLVSDRPIPQSSDWKEQPCVRKYRKCRIWQFRYFREISRSAMCSTFPLEPPFWHRKGHPKTLQAFPKASCLINIDSLAWSDKGRPYRHSHYPFTQNSLEPIWVMALMMTLAGKEVQLFSHHTGPHGRHPNLLR